MTFGPIEAPDRPKRRIISSVGVTVVSPGALVLIGQDLLATCRFTYDGRKRRLTMSYWHGHRHDRFRRRGACVFCSRERTSELKITRGRWFLCGRGVSGAGQGGQAIGKKCHSEVANAVPWVGSCRR